MTPYTPALRAACASVVILGAILGTGASAQGAYDPTEKSIGELEADLAAGRTTSVGLVEAYSHRIEMLNPKLRAVIVVNPRAMEEARTADTARAAHRVQGPLAGVPILIKDNIESADPMPTTAGSLALEHNMPGRDAPIVARLRAAGAIILGKTNLSEWANFRSSHSISGWSAVGGQARNPYALDRSPCGSSAGSGAATAASLAAAAIGTETDGSVTCPSAVAGLVGLKPTVGLVSRTHIVPISHTQDTAGPMARNVRDAALLLSAIAGSDSADPATAEADAHKVDYVAALDPHALRGVRIGVMRFAAGFHPRTAAAFEQALATLRAAGATLVEIEKAPDVGPLREYEQTILKTELKVDLAAYLATTSPEEVPTRTLADLIAFNRGHADRELLLFGQELFEESEATKGLDDPGYLRARSEAHRMAGPDGIDAMLAANNVSALVGPTLGPSWLIDPVLGDRSVGGGAGAPPAIAGYPHLTVPMGLVDGLPVGLSIIGPSWSEARLLAYGYAYEQASHARQAPSYREHAAPADAKESAGWVAAGEVLR
ncbi:MAG: amidase [Caulobacteraceae bacterium]|nr:amidase [Caulobacteraceae bacterium]